ncbi:MAG: histidine kinase dimerization/phosphoacceptor domain-containing protein [Ilumatobacteraceae bacterium]
MRAEFRSAQYTSWIAAVGVAIASALVDEPWGIAVGGVVAAGALARLTSRPALDRGDVRTAVWIATASNWLVTLAVAAIVPEAFPVLVVNVAGPPVLGALAFDRRELRPLVGCGVVVSIALGVIGFTAPGTGLADAVPAWFFEGVLVLFLAAHVMVMSSTVASSNQQYGNTVDEVLLANAALTRSDAELRASRRRVLAAGDAERERLERDIHDGAQQRLVALAVQLRLAAQLTERGSTASAAQLEAMHDECIAALDELRELARGSTRRRWPSAASSTRSARCRPACRTTSRCAAPTGSS